MEKYDFCDGGAFPEIHIPQFPFGSGDDDDGGRTAQGAQPPKSSRALTLQQSASTALTAHFFTSQELARPSAEEVEENARRTKDSLESALRAKVGEPAVQSDRQSIVVEYTPQLGTARTMEIVDAQRDPLDPSRTKSKRLPREATGDPAPIIRSPTKKPLDGPTTASFSSRGSGGALPPALAIPACVQNWKNPRNIAIPIEDRERADGRHIVDRRMGTSHFEIAAALRESEQQLAQSFSEQKEALNEKLENEQLAEEEALARRAREALKKESEKQAEERAKHRNETAEQRRERKAAEAEQREREREGERKQRRMEKMAQKLGLSVSEIEASDAAQADALVGLADSPDSQQTIGGVRHALQRRGTDDNYDEPLWGRRSGGGLKFDKDRIEEEMRRQDAQQQQQVQRQSMQQQSTSHGADDMFGLSEILNRKRAREAL